jgi:hypothetical protein
MFSVFFPAKRKKNSGFPGQSLNTNRICRPVPNLNGPIVNSGRQVARPEHRTRISLSSWNQNLSPCYSSERRKRATSVSCAHAEPERRSPPPPVASWPRMCGGSASPCLAV